MYKSIIIGAGISGLYIGLQLLKYKNDSDFVILEAQPKEQNHGRLLTYKNFGKDTKIELGASIFHSNQKKINDCIHLCNLTSEIIEYKSSTTYAILPDKTSEECNIYFKTLETKCKDYCLKNKKMDITLDECAKLGLTKKEYEDYKKLHYEWFEHYDKNAYIYFISSEKIGTICGMKNGLQSIVNKGCQILDDYIKYNSVISEISLNKIKNDKHNYQYQYNIKTNNNTYFCNYLYICTNSKNKIKYNLPSPVHDYIQLIKSKQCIRIYVEFNTELKNYPSYIVGDQIGKFSIKMSKNVWLIAYTDDIYAVKLNELDVKEIIINWIGTMNKIFKTEYTYENVVKYIKIYWDDAYTTLKKEYYKLVKNNKGNNKGSKLQYYGQSLKEKIKQNTNNLHLLFIPQNNGEDIAWMEAHLYKI
jgi:hypothetical protein